MDTGDFEEKIGYRFRDRKLLETALTHSSYCREISLPASVCNERLEFLGDAFLDAVAGYEMYTRLPDEPEGVLTKRRAAAVCGAALEEVGRKLGIGSYMRLGAGEKNHGGSAKPSIIADATEAVIGAVFIDGGYDEAKRFILREFSGIIEKAAAGKLFRDYKSEIQEKLQESGRCPVIEYEEVSESGPDHDKTFVMRLLCNGREIGRGKGRSKKLAEQKAAEDALGRF
ncbi:MAG: ribonuclease III [Anaerovoracaceae bacterium]